MYKEVNPGLAVDAKGNPVVDPTANVLQLVEAAVARINDLRETDRKYDSDVHVIESRRLDDLRAAESRRINEIMELRELYGRELREAEAKRIDAIRAVDVNAVAVASERASDQATVLASQVSQSADALRTLVATTAATMAAQQDTLTRQFNDRIAQIEKSQYESKGKSGVTDPLFESLIRKMDLVAERLSTDKGTKEGTTSSMEWIIRTILFGIAIAGFIVGFIK